jgi:hypothetical protein
MANQLQGTAEENVITLLIWNNEHASMLASILEPEIFSTRAFQRIAEAAIKFIVDYRHAPQGHIRDVMENELKRSEGKFMASIIDETQRVQADLDPNFVIGGLDDWMRRQSKMNALENALEVLQAGDETKADELIWGQPAFRSRMTRGTWLHDTDLSFVEQTSGERFSSGVEELDIRGIRPERGTFTLFIAPKKAGKSWWCVNLGKANFRDGHTTLHMTLENSEKLTKRRYVQAFNAWTKREAQTVQLPKLSRDPQTGRLSGMITLHEYQAMGLMTASKQEIVRRLQSFGLRPRLLIKGWPTGALTVPQLDAYLDMLAREENFVPDLLIIDYPDLMSINADNLRIDTGRLSQQLRGLCVRRDMALCAPTQGNRATEGAKLFGSKGVSEDWSKVGTADTVLTFNRTDEERKMGLARILVDAARDEEDKFRVLISQSYVTGQFHLSSVYMDQATESELDRVTGKQPAEEQTEETDEAEHGK